MSDSYDDPYFIESDSSGIDYACFIDLIKNSESLLDDESIDCIELGLEDDIEELDFDD